MAGAGKRKDKKFKQGGAGAQNNRQDKQTQSSQDAGSVDIEQSSQGQPTSNPRPGNDIELGSSQQSGQSRPSRTFYGNARVTEDRRTDAQIPSGGRGAGAPGGRGTNPPNPPAPGVRTLPNRPGDQRTGNSSQQDLRPRPSEKVTNAENAAIAQMNERRNAPLKVANEIVFPRRPGYGTQGDKYVVQSNYFPVIPQEGFQLHICSVDVKDPRATAERPTAVRRKKRAFEMLFREAVFQSHLPALATDYATLLITLEKLELKREPAEYVVHYCEVEDEVRAQPTDQAARNPDAIDHNRITFTIRQKPPVLMQDFLAYIESADPQARFDDKETIFQALNLVMARKPSTDTDITTVANSSKFFPHSGVFRDPVLGRLGGGLLPLRGYSASVRMATSRLLLNVNCITSAFYENISLTNLIGSFLQDGNNDSLLGSFLKGVRVKLTHLPLSKARTIYGLSPGGKNADQYTFRWKPEEGKPESETNVTRYFFLKYGARLSKRAMLINVGNSANPVLVPVEQCVVLPGQMAKKKLSQSQTTSMINVAVRTPQENANSILQQGVGVMGFRDDSTDGPKVFKLDVVSDMVRVEARILTPPNLLYRNGQSVMPRNGGWNMQGKQFHLSVTLPHWTCMEIQWKLGQAPRNGYTFTLENFRDGLDSELRKCGLNTGSYMPPSQDLLQLDQGTSPKNTEELLKCLGLLKKRGVKMVYIVIPRKDKELYAAVKFVADVKIGIITVLSSKETMAKQDDNKYTQYCANVALKFNLKGGGINHQLAKSNRTLLEYFKYAETTMFVGIDVTHPSPGSLQQSPSIASVVASIDKTCGQWPGSVFLQSSRVEILADLERVMTGRLELWRKKNRVYPQRIIVYRDGVSEGEYKIVLEKELAAIRRATEKVRKEKTHVSIIIVGKRHHTRFYPNTNDSGQHITFGGNLKNGLVVDRGITSTRQWDFFLQAHHAIKGTARPAHLVVLLDENDLGVDGLETLTHNLCHLYGRATKAVSLPVPIFYAHLLCERGRCYLYDTYHPPSSKASVSSGAGGTEKYFDPVGRWDGKIHEDLEDTMYYV